MSELLHRLRHPSPAIIQAVIYIAIAAVLWRPSSPVRLLSLAAACVAGYLSILPATSSFLTMVFTVNTTLLLGGLWQCWKMGLRQLAMAALLQPLRPLLLFIVCGSYAFSVVHKLNHAFLDPELSDAVYWLHAIRAETYPWLLSWINDVIPEPGPATSRFIILWTLVIESAIPTLLVFRRTRLMGIGLDFVFHVIMAYRMYPPSTNFPAAMLALLILPMPQDAAIFLGMVKQSLMACSPIAIAWRLRKFAGVVLTLTMFPLVMGSATDEIHWLREFIRSSYWHGCVLCYATLFAGYLWRRRHQPARSEDDFRWNTLQPRWLSAIGLMFSLNAMAPHLGLKSRASLEMFSNLDTLDGRSNHLFIPATFQCFDYLSDVVMIEEAREESDLALAARQRWVMPYLEFENLASRYPDEPLTYRHKGRRRTLQRLGEILSDEQKKHNWLERKLLAMHIQTRNQWRKLHHTKNNPATKNSRPKQTSQKESRAMQ